MHLNNVSQLDGDMKDAECCSVIGDGRLGTLTLCDHRQPLNIEVKGPETEIEGLCMSGWFAEFLCFVFVFNQQHYPNVSAHCNSGCLHVRSPTGHLRLYIYEHHDEAPKQEEHEAWMRMR